jgi:hypothetical protein
MIIGTMFTLFVVPSIYMLVAQTHRRELEVGEPEAAGADLDAVGAPV